MQQSKTVHKHVYNCLENEVTSVEVYEQENNDSNEKENLSMNLLDVEN